MVVEDEYFIADEVATGLRGAGAHVIGPYPTVDGAARQMETDEARLDAAVLDLNLGGATSVELIRRLRQQRVPVILATGYDVASLMPELRGLPRCEKPFTARVLMQVIAAHLI
jgi:DNA-binding response OmpR family regulator